MRLRAGDVWKASARPAEVAIECQRGSVWITQENDSRDVVLNAGQRFVNTLRGHLVVQAMTAAVVRITRVFRRVWRGGVVLLAMAGAIPLARDYDSTVPGFGIMMAIIFGLLAYYLVEELAQFLGSRNAR